MTSSTLQVHVFMLSATTTFGLLILFHVITTYGALVAGLTMTFLQFISIICNALAFENMGSITPGDWVAIGLEASGIWIKTNRRYDAVKTENDGPQLKSQASFQAEPNFHESISTSPLCCSAHSSSPLSNTHLCLQRTASASASRMYSMRSMRRRRQSTFNTPNQVMPRRKRSWNLSIPHIYQGLSTQFATTPPSAPRSPHIHVQVRPTPEP